jgi:iron complex transport system ATP-binding protein
MPEPSYKDSVSLQKTALLQAHGISYARDGRYVIQGVDLRAQGGDRIAVLGNNGAGKSTLLCALAGVLPERGGSVQYMGAEISALSLARRMRAVAWLPQSLWQAEHFSVRQFLSLQPSQDTKSERSVLESNEASFFHISALLTKDIRELSGGEWRRVQLAKTFGSGANTLILDEPSAGLDLRHVSALVGALEASTKDGSRAAVFSTHDLAFASAAASHVLVLDEGRSMFFGTLEAFCASGAAQRLFGVPVFWQKSETADGPCWFPHVLLRC